MAKDIGSVWGADTPISMPEPSTDLILIDMGAFGFSEAGLQNNLTSADVEEYQQPPFSPVGTRHG